MALLVLYFSPDHLRNPSNFEAVSNKLICSPVTQILVFTKVGTLSKHTLCFLDCQSQCQTSHMLISACAPRMNLPAFCCRLLGCVITCWHGLPEKAEHCGLSEHMATVQIPGPVRKWVDQICKWDFKRVISAHFNSPVEASPADFRCARISHAG